jgi:PPP family 3-phenylpropionic acid transporter
MGVLGGVVWGYLSDRSGKPRVWIALGAFGALLVNQFIPYVNGFWAFLAISSLGSLLGSAPNTLVDSTTLVLLGKRREDYGKYRLGGSIGYIIATFISAFLFQQTGLRMIFPAYGLAMACFSITALLLPNVPVRLQSSGSREVGTMIRQRTWLLFILCIFLCWIAVNASIMFLSVTLNAMGANQTLIGLSSTIPGIVEVPFMLFSGFFLRRFGPEKLLLAGMVLMVVRFFLLGIMPSPGWAIWINMLNGPAFVFYWNSAINYANQRAPHGLAATAQGLVSSTVSLASVVSSLLSGWLFDQVGPNGIFLVMSGLCLVALGLYAGGIMKRKPGG